MRLKYKIKNFFKYGPRNFITGIQNLIKWRKIIWNTRNWDYMYLEYIILFKMQEIYPVLKNGHAAPLPDNPEYWKGVKAMKICITILERRKSSFYSHIWDGEKETIELTNNIEKRDWIILCELLKKYECYWWD